MNDLNSQDKVRSEKESSKVKQDAYRALFGATFTVLWVLACAYAFSVLIGYAGGKITSENQEVAASLIWPFVGVALAVPLIIFLWFGGVAALSQLRAIRRHLESLDTYVDRFDSMADKANEAKSHLQESQDIANKLQSTASEASNTILRNLTDFENELKDWVGTKLTEGSIPQDAAASTKIRTEEKIRFDQMYAPVINDFYDLLSKRNESPGRGRRQLYLVKGGWNKIDLLDQILDELRSDGREFNADKYAIMHQVFELEHATRFHARRNINSLDLEALEKKVREFWSLENEQT